MFATTTAKEADAIRKEIKAGDQSWRQDINARHVGLQLKVIRNALDDLRFAIECRDDAPDLARLNAYCAGQMAGIAGRLAELAKIITHEEAVPMPVETEIAIRLHNLATEAKE